MIHWPGDAEMGYLTAQPRKNVPKHDPPTSLAAYVEGLFNNLSQLLPLALRKSQPLAIHRVRVTTRRLNSVIQLLKSHPDGKALDKTERDLKKLRRRLGRIRDIDVMVRLLRRYRTEYPETVGWLQSDLHKRREKEKKAKQPKWFARFVEPGAGKDVVKAVVDCEETVRPLLARVIRAQFTDLCRRADSLMLTTGNGGPPDVHSVRIAGKRFRYALELAVAAGAPLEKRHQENLKHIQDVLGQWHDQAVLVQFAMKMAARKDLALVNPDLLREMLGFMQDIVGSSRRQIEEFIAAWQRDRGELSAAINELERTLSPKANNDPEIGRAHV